jgi:hypothetical protein
MLRKIGFAAWLVTAVVLPVAACESDYDASCSSSCDDSSYDDSASDTSYEDDSYEDDSYEDDWYEDDSYEDDSYEDDWYDDDSYDDPSYEDSFYGDPGHDDAIAADIAETNLPHEPPVDISDLTLDPNDPTLSGAEPSEPTQTPACEPICEPGCDLLCETICEPTCELAGEPICEPIDSSKASDAFPGPEIQTAALPEPPVETAGTTATADEPGNQFNEPPIVLAALLMPPRASTDQPGPSSEPVANAGSQQPADNQHRPSQKPSLAGECVRAAVKGFVNRVVTNVALTTISTLSPPVGAVVTGLMKAKSAVDTVRTVVSAVGGIRTASADDIKSGVARTLSGMVGSAAGNRVAPVGTTGHVQLEPAKNGSYTVEFESGKAYAGKGGTDRARRSARQRSRANNDPVKSIDHTPAPSDTEAFKQEAGRLKKIGGPESPDNYNQINSPGKNIK